MAASGIRREGPRNVLQVGLLIACGLAAFGAHAILEVDSVSDGMALAVSGGTLLFVSVSTVVAFILAVRSTSRAVRFARMTVSVALVALFAVFVKASYAGASVDLQSIIDSRQTPDHDTTLAVGPGGQDIRLSGEIRDGLALRLAALLDANPTVTRIHLTSEGGLADEGQALGDVIAKHHLVTFVPDYCVSACTLAFVRGSERLGMADARIGFHAPYERGLFGETFQDDSAAQRVAYLDAGIDKTFVDEALKVAPADLWVPTTDRLIAARVMTRVVDRYLFPDSSLDGDATKAAAKELILRNFPILAPFQAKAPRVVDAIAATYLAAYQHAHSEGQMVDELKALVKDAVAMVMVRADDETLEDLARYVALAIGGDGDDDACVAIGSTADLVAAEHLFADVSFGNVGLSADAAAAAIVKKALESGGNIAVAVPRSSTMPATFDAGRRSCAEVQKAYRKMLQGETADAATAIRARVAVLARKGAGAMTRLAQEDR